ncbi:TetR/AcrR family transcriptional regulator [Acetobacter papayae]|uniref:TetR/AcrR family transcriptional regulator n=1 Tax=Acetobacter papayae TaxID=1076592 RepID=UPI0009DDCA52|nr:TetR/AcrR family transcriptional regulator [Acetobacter papayae]
MKIGRPKEVSDEHIVAIARRCFLERGGSISAADIAREIGVSHTTLFNRFGSKQGLMLAALGAPKEIHWIGTLEAGPDNRPIREQLVEIACTIAAFFEALHAGFTVLQASGIATDALCSGEDPEQSAPARAFRALTEWIDRAQEQGKLARCDAQVLASTCWVFCITGPFQTASAANRVLIRQRTSVMLRRNHPALGRDQTGVLAGFSIRHRVAESARCRTRTDDYDGYLAADYLGPGHSAQPFCNGPHDPQPGAI